jgi:hypothetical protein
MAAKLEVKGKCLCGAVSYSAELASPDVTICHCNMCRRWTGGVLMALMPSGKPAFSGEENIAVYQSSEWGERGFCKTCGSNLFWKLAGVDEYHLAAGALEDTSALKMASEIFVEEQPKLYSFANVPVRMTGQEFIDALMAQKEKH